jgi:hypothetical protein
MSDVRETIHILTDALDRACRSLGFRDYMPDPMIGHFVKQVVPVSFSANKLDMNQFYQWVRKEYSVPDHVFSRVFSRLIEEAAEQGVKVLLPDSFDPSFDEVIKEYLRYDHLPQEPGAPLPQTPAAKPRLDHAAAGFADADEQIMSVLETPFFPEEPAPAPAPAPEAQVEPARAPDVSIEEIKREVEARLRPEIERELHLSLWPVVYEEVREQLRSELRSGLAVEVRPEVEVALEQELRGSLEARIRDELYPVIHEKVSAEIAAVEHERISRTMEEKLRAELREELRKELWDEVREEVKQDLRTVLTPVLEEEMRKELAQSVPEPAPPAIEPVAAGPARPAGLCAQDHLDIIRKIRQELAPRIRENLLLDLAALARAQEERERDLRRQAQLADPEYCLEKIREFLFPDQPSLWAKIKPFIAPDDWTPIVRSLEAEAPAELREKLSRSRAVIRDALIIKAEIEEEMNYRPSLKVPGGAKSGGRSIKKTLSGAEQVLDFTLRSISALLEQGPP